MDYLNYFLPAIQHFGMFGYWFILLVSFAESLAFVGMIIPGGVLVVTAGFLSANGYFYIGDLIWFAAIGAMLGDGVSYYLGTKGTRFFRNENKMLKLSHLDRGQLFFRKHGNKSIFLGRFIGPLRPIVPFIAGLSRMSKLSFFFWNAVSAFLWAASYLFLGYFFGGTAKSIGAWSTRAGIFMFFLFLFLIFIWFIIKKSGKLFDFSKSVIFSIRDAIVENKDVREFVKNHQVFFNFMRQRTDTRKFSGLSLTLLFIAFVYIISVFFGVARNIIISGPIIDTDIRVENLFYAFRDFELAKTFIWITLLAKWQMVISFAITTSLIFWLWKKKTCIIPLWITAVGSGLFSVIVKLMFHRARPEFALYVENTYSFPSTHSTIAAAFFGFIIYILLKRARRWEYKINILFGGLSLILFIGLSRLYLGVHFLSDVWGGYLLGLLWLIIGIAILEWLNSRRKPIPYSPSWKVKLISLTIIFVQMIVYAGFVFNYDPSVNINKEPTSLNTIIVRNVSDVSSEHLSGQSSLDKRLSRFTETLFGENQEPISFAVVAESDQSLIDNMRAAGWYLADQTDISSVVQLAKSAIFSRSYPNAPMTPSFWNSKVNDFGFEKPTSAENVRERHHARFWRTQFKTADGGRIYVGTASLDSGIKWFITHKIKPDIDTEREILFADLENGGLILNYEKTQSVEPTLGENFSGDQFFTDGKLYLITLNRETRQGASF